MNLVGLHWFLPLVQLLLLPCVNGSRWQLKKEVRVDVMESLEGVDTSWLLTMWWVLMRDFGPATFADKVAVWWDCKVPVKSGEKYRSGSHILGHGKSWRSWYPRCNPTRYQGETSRSSTSQCYRH